MIIITGDNLFFFFFPLFYFLFSFAAKQRWFIVKSERPTLPWAIHWQNNPSLLWLHFNSYTFPSEISQWWIILSLFCDARQIAVCLRGLVYTCVCVCLQRPTLLLSACISILLFVFVFVNSLFTAHSNTPIIGILELHLDLIHLSPKCSEDTSSVCRVRRAFVCSLAANPSDGFPNISWLCRLNRRPACVLA